MMGLELTKDQYRTLLELVFIGNWVASANSPGAVQAKYDALEQFLFSQARECGLADLVRESGDPSEEFLDTLFPLIDQYNEHNFWENLVELLVQRDLAQQYDTAAWAALDDKARFNQIEELEEKYFRIFEQNGINALRLVGPAN